MQFGSLAGQEKNVQRILSALQTSQLGHAYLFHGGNGSGKFPFSLALTEYLFCERRTDQDSCGTCPSCRRTSKLVHPDVHFVFPYFSKGKSSFYEETVSDDSGEMVKTTTSKTVCDDLMREFRESVLKNPYLDLEDWQEVLGGENKQLNIPVHEIRHLRSKMNYKSFEGKYKVVIIWRADKMNTQAGNSLLKLLEEPPENTLLLLTALSADSMLPTIISRCQSLYFPPVQDEELKKYIDKNFHPDSSRVNEISSLSGGNVNMAIKILEKNENPFPEYFQKWMRAVYKGKPDEILTASELFSGFSREELKSFFDYVMQTFRETLHIKLGTGQNQDDKENFFLKNFSKTISLLALQDIYDLLNKHYYYLERNASFRMLLITLSNRIHSVFERKS